MSAIPQELLIREQTKLTLKYLENGLLEQARQIILNNKEILRYNFGLINFVPLIPRVRFSKIIPKNNDALKMIINAGFEIFSQEDDFDELMFFAAAKCDIKTLKNCLSKIVEKNSKGVHQVREGDTVLLFLIKYGNVADKNFPECMRILIDSGVDVNKGDYFSHYPIVFLIELYQKYMNKQQKNHLVLNNLKTCIEMILKTKTVNLDELKAPNTERTIKDMLRDLQFEKTYYVVENNIEEERDKLFKFLIACDEESFIKSLTNLDILDADDGNNTYLQLCCEKNLKKAAVFLINKGADLTKTTGRNLKTPLEIAARRNHSEIFEALLGTNKIVISEELFRTFLRNRPKHIRAKYFDEILKYNNLDMNIRSNNGNTPLHYAIIFSSNEAIEVLLRRGASLTVQNNNMKCPLDYISPEDLDNHFNKCIVSDYYTDVSNVKYELALNYQNFVECEGTNVKSELTVVEKICNSPKLCYLVTHPLVSSFFDIKWKLVEPLYKRIFFFNIIFYFFSIFSFINLNLLKYLGIVLAFVYGFKICYFPFYWKSNKFHLAVDSTISVVLFISSVFISNNHIKYQLGIMLTVLMALSLHLLCRFSPKFAQFHSVLIRILSNTFSYLSYVFVLSLFFGAASYIFFLLRYEQEYSLTSEYLSNFFDSLKTLLPQFYLLCSFAVFVSVIIVITVMNSLAILQEHANKIENNAQLFGHKNILIFLRSIEDFYLRRRIITSPFIFDDSHLSDMDGCGFTHPEHSTKKSKKISKNKNKYLLNFFINKNMFSFEKLLFIKLSDSNICKIRKKIKH